jgi:hypothetical protein
MEPQQCEHILIQIPSNANRLPKVANLIRLFYFLVVETNSCETFVNGPAPLGGERCNPVTGYCFP